MPDTGAPWLIPYLDGTELVRDYPQASEDLADAIAAGLTAAGVVKQIVQTVKTDTFSVSLATGVESGDVTGLTVTITPTSASSKVLVEGFVSTSVAANRTYISLARSGSVITDVVGDASGSRPRRMTGGNNDGSGTASLAFSYLDSPATTSAVTYSIRVSSGLGAGTDTVHVNRTPSDQNDGRGTRTASVIRATEVAA
jgi:hypothetical protein